MSEAVIAVLEGEERVLQEHKSRTDSESAESLTIHSCNKDISNPGLLLRSQMDFNTRWSWRSRRKWSDFVIHRVNSPKKHLKHLRLQECRCIIKSVWFFPRPFPYNFYYIFGNQITMLSIIDYTECSLKVIFRFYFYNHKITSTEVP